MSRQAQLDSAAHAKRIAYIDRRLRAVGPTRVKKVQVVAREGGPDLISGALLLAIMLRESGGRNVGGDQGHARGALQIHDNYWHGMLASVRGCRMAATIADADRPIIGKRMWIPVPGRNAAEPGYCPTIEDGARIAVVILSGYVRQAQAANITAVSDLIAVAVAAYNCGFGWALRGHREGDPSKYTTGKDYARDVIARRSEVSEWLRAHPRWRPS